MKYSQKIILKNGKEALLRNGTAADDVEIAAIIRKNLKAVGLDIPGTAYFDKELDCLSKFYQAFPDKRAYFIAASDDGSVLGGVGIAEYAEKENCAEIQKLYLSDAAKGKGLGKLLMKTAEDFARQAGYASLYLETHTCLEAAVGLYKKLGFQPVERPEAAKHGTMNLFFMKKLA